MRTNFFIAAILFAGIFTSCKNEKSVGSSEGVESPVVDNNFKITLNVIVKRDDDFSLFYTEDGSINFTGEPIWLGVKGSENIQQVVYNLPDEVFPTELRLDFGMKEDQEDIILKGVTLEYKGRKKEIVGANLINFFIADENKCTFDPSTGTIKAIIKDGVRQFPSLYPQEVNLKPEIKKLAE